MRTKMIKPVLFHSKTEMMIAVSVLFFMMDQRPLKTAQMLQSKNIVSGKVAHSKKTNRQKYDLVPKDKHLEKSLLSQYFVPEKRPIFPSSLSSTFNHCIKKVLT